MTKEISREDVIQVGNDLNKNLSDSTIDWVLEEYDSWAKFDTTSHWTEIVESMLYSNKSIMKFTPTSETARQEVLEYSLNELTDQQLKEELSRRGFFTDNLWSVHDVKGIFSVNDEEAQDILDEALTNEATMEQIWFSIRTFGDMGGHRRVDEFQVGDFVLVPDPNESDIHNHEFLGVIKLIRGEYATIEDGDGDCFDIELDRLEHE
jgi:hypothetical protein